MAASRFLNFANPASIIASPESIRKRKKACHLIVDTYVKNYAANDANDGCAPVCMLFLFPQPFESSSIRLQEN